MKGILIALVGVVIWQEYRMRIMEEKLDVVGEVAGTLLEESYQKEIDEEFDEIIEQNDLE